MKKISVRCWKVPGQFGVKKDVDLYVTYPEGNCGHKLITCLSCGEVYAVSVEKEVYVGPKLREKLHDVNCVACGESLEENFAYYPESYFDSGGVGSYQRPEEIPADSDSLVREFWGIYE